MVETQREMKCGKCGYRWIARGKVERDLGFPETSACPSDEECGSKSFSVVPGSEVLKDYQEIKIQEQMQKLEFGTIPRSMFVILMDDLVDSCKAGDDVTIGGIVTRRWRSFSQDERPQVDLVFVANKVESMKEQRENHVFEELTEEMEQFWQKYKECPLKGRAR